MSKDNLGIKLEYKILCIDDNESWFESVISRVIEPKHITIDWRQDTDFDPRSSSNIHTYDLILVDYNLNNDHKGDDHIRCFRDEKGCLTNIIFYSSQDISGCDVSSWDGVISCTRDEVAEELKKTIESFGYRLSDHNIMRGLILAEAIDVENQLGKIILQVFNDEAEFFEKNFFIKSKVSFSQKYELVISYLKKARYDGDDFVKRIKHSLKNFQDEIVTQRNILAHGHQSLDDERKGVIITGYTKSGGKLVINFDNEWKNTIRQNIRKHKDNLNKLYDYIKENQQA
ncbi:hypothetical protein [Cysteiniphilum sp. QT6929]|uniref:hypothetical protein n=1 Tax=Cysteiniphilum sp. QT6929 TaxID=2975055 RepID=UPI0024B38D46|nr:hypothetical protein [Cysteiniphilum sp. QT6929]WHN64517.1 hypothetical protein NYP54_05475 [Cysteiniphilum sp. QT6929]